MHALMIEDLAGSEVRRLTRSPLTPEGAGRDEKWLQALLFGQSELIPIDAIEPGAARMVPVCRELPIPKQGATVFLDILGVTSTGRLVLVECKLWRNPQARREVIAQILEYAALVRQWSYGDLTARLKSHLGWTGRNPLFEHVRRWHSETDEATFVDHVSQSLRVGDFILIVAGDGIRSDLQAIAAHLNAHSGLAAKLALVEFQLWSDDAGRTMVVPAVPLRTEVIQQRVVVASDGLPLKLEVVSDEANETEAIVDPERASQREASRAFWQRFIDTVQFDHPDQPPPRHGGVGWVKIDMPEPASWMTAYRTQDGSAGLFVTLKGEDGAAVFEALSSERARLEDEVGLPVAFEVKGTDPFKGTVSVCHPGPNPSDEQLMPWLCATANRMVNALRPRISPLMINK
jgi:hypothetical protein